MAASKFYNIIVMPGDHGATRQFRVSRRLLVLGASLVVLHLVVMTVFVTTYSRVLVRSRRVSTLETENASLREQVTQVDRLRHELDRLTALRGQVLTMLGVDVSARQAQQDGADAAAPWTTTPPELMGLEHAKAAESLRAFSPQSWPVDGYISKEFFQEESEGQPAHPGLDLVAPVETPVKAAGRGRVTEAGWDETLGNYIVIDHGFGFTTMYGHTARLLVSPGQVVDRDQVIALLGNTGKSSAPHLHFEVRVDGMPVDPRRYLTPR
jgi:murein DD-endopeptidase MepM/ murein hydrolase activator NlpD